MRSGSRDLPDAEIPRRVGRGIRALAVRNIGGRILAMFGGLALAALLGPADFAIYAVAMALLGVMHVLTSAGTTAAILRRRQEPTPLEVRALFTFQLLLGCALVAAALIVTFVVLPTIGFGAEGARAAGVLTLVIPLSAVKTIPLTMLERRLEYGRISVVDLVEQGAFYVVALGFVLFGIGIWSLAPAGIASALLAATLATAMRPTPMRPTLRFSVLLPLWRFAAKFQGNHLLVTVRDFGLPMLLLLFAGAHVAGVWALAHRLLVPVLSIFQAFWRVGFVSFSRADEPTAQSHAQSLLNGSALVAGMVLAPVVGSAPALARAILGEQWVDIVAPVTLAAIGWVVAGPISCALLGLVQARGDLRVPARIVALQMVILWSTAVVVAPHVGALAIGGAWLAALLVEAAILLHFSRRYAMLNLRPLATAAAIAGFAAVAGRIVAETASPSFGLLGSVAVALSLWLILAWLIMRDDLLRAPRAVGLGPRENLA
jgi:O-antigen/teichoic acid export membrane protein